jgi:hypothetical protein
MEYCNDHLLQLVECIESIKNEVKRKVKSTVDFDATSSPVTLDESVAQRKKLPRGERYDREFSGCDACAASVRRCRGNAAGAVPPQVDFLFVFRPALEKTPRCSSFFGHRHVPDEGRIVRSTPKDLFYRPCGLARGG